MLPGVASEKSLAAANLDERCSSARWRSSIDDREGAQSPECSRRAGRSESPRAPTKVEDVTRCLKMHRSMRRDEGMSMGPKRGAMPVYANMLGLGGGMPSPERCRNWLRRMPGRHHAWLPPAYGGGGLRPPCRPAANSPAPLLPGRGKRRSADFPD